MPTESEQHLKELAELYCLGLADDGQVAEIESRLKQGDPDLAREVERLRPVSEALLALAATVTPPPQLRGKIAASLGIAQGTDDDHAALRRVPDSSSRPGRLRFPPAAWAAIAALLLLAVWGWWPRLIGGGHDPLSGYRVLAADPGTVSWSVGGSGEWAGKGNVGTFLWNAALQRGYLRVAGVDVNNPGREQFQGWLFDSSRDKHAVSGGVFDISASTPRDAAGNYIIEIRPDLRVTSLNTFAVTIERPGGVVVTDASRLVMAAKGGGL
jgi:anti-sigma-K factor RskA